MTSDFTDEQKRYLEGLVAGLAATRGGTSDGAPTGPDRLHLEAMARTEAAGGKLSDQEKWKREEHPLDAYARLKEQAAAGTYPKPADNFRWRYFGLFYVAPAQDSYMLRLRIANGILNAHQFAGVADIAEAQGGGYAHVTTRANLQIREIKATDAVDVVERVMDLGLSSRGSGADNIRNVTGDATAGICPTELLDTRSTAREWHFHVLNDRSLQGLPRKFNVSFDGGGTIPTLEETNDIGFQAVEVTEGATYEGATIEAGVWFRLMLGGISGHRDLARDTGVLVRPADATKVADAILRVFIREGDRTNRAKARLKYVLDRYAEDGRGFEGFLAVVEAVMGQKLTRVEAKDVKPRPAQNRQAHIGAHAQKQKGLHYLGVVLPVGKMTPTQMRDLAAIARELGDGDIRLTVWLNLLISGIPTAKLADAKKRVKAAGLDWQATAVRAGLVACTGSTGCKFANANTKDTAMKIAAHVDAKLKLETPINIHLTGCPNSCAQHYIGDIGLIGAKVPVGDDGDTVEGFHIVLGGGFGADAAIAQDIWRDVKTEDCPAAVETLLAGYLKHRSGPKETFGAFSRRHDAETLKALLVPGTRA
jgi:ferredoxin-nitrite reductase